MGEPVRIIDLARDLMLLAGRDPDSHLIETVGLRPGEKLHEELFYDAEHAKPTSSAKVLRTDATPPPASIREDASRMLTMATGADEPSLRSALLAYVSEFAVVPLEELAADVTEPSVLKVVASAAQPTRAAVEVETR